MHGINMSVKIRALHCSLHLHSSCSGPLSAVTDLETISSTNSVVLSWNAPWSLNVTGFEHDIWYSVVIQNVTDEDNPTDILCTKCTNITETQFIFTPEYPSPNDVYNFTVIPVNGAGEGERSDSVTGYVSYGGYNIINFLT